MNFALNFQVQFHLKGTLLQVLVIYMKNINWQSIEEDINLNNHNDEVTNEENSISKNIIN